jgi:hypothetical protein
LLHGRAGLDRLHLRGGKFEAQEVDGRGPLFVIGVEDRMFVEVRATSASLWSRREPRPRERIGCDHRNYLSHAAIPPETLASLAGDLRPA